MEEYQINDKNLYSESLHTKLLKEGYKQISSGESLEILMGTVYNLEDDSQPINLKNVIIYRGDQVFDKGVTWLIPDPKQFYYAYTSDERLK